jgi:Uma2 family endonuclease
MAVPIERMLFTVDRYEKMIEAGVLGREDHVELIHGEIVRTAPIGLRHAACVARLTALFAARLGGSVIVWPQNPVRIGANSEPEPDVALLRPRADFYENSGPTAQDALLLIEVADTSVERDREVKLPLYAKAGVPAVWIVNFVEDVVEEYGAPAGDAYTVLRVARRGESVALPFGEGMVLKVDEVLG